MTCYVALTVKWRTHFGRKTKTLEEKEAKLLLKNLNHTAWGGKALCFENRKRLQFSASSVHVPFTAKICSTNTCEERYEAPSSWGVSFVVPSGCVVPMIRSEVCVGWRCGKQEATPISRGLTQESENQNQHNQGSNLWRQTYKHQQPKC